MAGGLAGAQGGALCLEVEGSKHCTSMALSMAMNLLLLVTFRLGVRIWGIVSLYS